jgi:nicotinamide mononucleotide adenylyltransferase
MSSASGQQQQTSHTTATPLISLENYRLPLHRLQLRNVEAGKTPLVLVACGSFSPTTFLHLRMFSLAYDYVKSNTNFTVVGAYLSPVSDAYKKVGLAPAHHRIAMAEQAVHTRTSTTELLMVDPWEAIHAEYM